MALRTIPDRACETCGITFRPRVQTRRYCSQDCSKAARVRIPRICPECGNAFVASNPDTQRFCSRSCAAADKKRRPRIYPNQICPRCGEVFNPKSRRQVFCAPSCRTTQPRLCEQCGELFIPRHPKANRFCSRACLGANKRARPRPDALEKFRSKVDENGPIQEHVPELGSCAVWTGNRNRQGYGRFIVPGTTKTVGAHRWIYERTHGPIGEGLWICHKCDFPPCVRVDHLFAGTAQDNHDDQKAKGRTMKGRPRPTRGSALRSS